GRRPMRRILQGQLDRIEAERLHQRRTLADDVGCHRRVPDPQVGANGRGDHEYPLGERFRQDDDVLVQGTWWVETPRRCDAPTFHAWRDYSPPPQFSG